MFLDVLKKLRQDTVAEDERLNKEIDQTAAEIQKLAQQVRSEVSAESKKK
jgi:hypothetical protein